MARTLPPEVGKFCERTVAVSLAALVVFWRSRALPPGVALALWATSKCESDRGGDLQTVVASWSVAFVSGLETVMKHELITDTASQN